MTQSTAKDTVSLALLLFMCSGAFFVARGGYRIGRTLLVDLAPTSTPVEQLRSDGFRDLVIAIAVIGGGAIVALVTFSLW